MLLATCVMSPDLSSASLSLPGLTITVSLPASYSTPAEYRPTRLMNVLSLADTALTILSHISSGLPGSSFWTDAIMPASSSAADSSSAGAAACTAFSAGLAGAASLFGAGLRGLFAGASALSSGEASLTAAVSRSMRGLSEYLPRLMYSDIRKLGLSIDMLLLFVLLR